MANQKSSQTMLQIRLVVAISILLGAACAVVFAASSSKSDQALYQDYFKNRFPNVPFEELANGVYALDPVARENWEALEEFPPYEPYIDVGENHWNNHLEVYESCFTEGPGVKHRYPQWSKELKTVITLPYAINLCRENNGLGPLDYLQDEIIALEAYMAYQSRDKTIDVSVPNDDPKAVEAYQAGKRFYFTRRGQLNFACYHCHFDNAGKNLRTEMLGPAVGQTTGWPTYRNKWGDLGPLHRRYIGCNNQVRAEPFAAQSEEYRNLEWFHTMMSNGLPINGPSVRR